MKLEINGRIVEVDDSFANLPPDQQQKTVESIAAQMSSQPGFVSQMADKLGVSAQDPLLWGGVGTVGGLVLGPMVTEAGRRALQIPGGAPGAGAVDPRAPGQKYIAKTGYGAGPGETVREVVEEFKEQRKPIGEGKISKTITKNKPLTIADYQAQKAREEMEARMRAKNAPLSQKLPPAGQAAVRAAEGAASKFPAWLARGAAGASTGFQAADAINRLREGDIGGGIVSGLGALGSVVSFIPHPLTRIGGTALAAGAPLLLGMMEDKKEETGGVNNPMAMGGPVGYARGKAVVGGLDSAKKFFAPKQTKVVKASEALGPHADKYLYVTESDRMRSTGGDLGGPGFSKFQLEDPRYAEAKAAWGVASKPKATSITNINKRFPEDKIIWSPFIGAEAQHRSNQHVYDMLTDEFSRQAAMGKLTPELREAMNKRLSDYKKYSALKLSGLDVANPEMLKQMGNTFDRRAAISEVIGGEGVGGRKGQIFDYPGIMKEMTDPMALGQPTHSVGTRLFSLTGDTDYRPDLHSAFPYILKGEDKGVAFSPVPKELMLGNWIEQVKDFTGRQPGYMEFMRGVKGGHGRPNAFLSQELLRKLEDAGYKSGGLAHI